MTMPLHLDQHDMSTFLCRPWARVASYLALAAGVLLAFGLVNRGVDFPVLYEMGRGIVHGTNVYLPSQTTMFLREFGVDQYGMFYPPSTGFLMVPFSLVPYSVSAWIFASLTVIAIVIGIRQLFSLSPDAGLRSAWPWVAALVLASSAMRWGMMLLQIAPAVLGLLCLFTWALHSGRERLATAIATVVLSLKITLSLPFLGILAVHRRFGALAASIGVFVALNGLGFWRFGPESFDGYRANLALLEDMSSISAPDPWLMWALPRLDWTYLLYGLTGDLALSRAAGLTLAAAVALWVGWNWLRKLPAFNATATACYLAVLVSLGSLGVYHHHYDAALFFAPAILVPLLGARALSTMAVALCLPLLTIILLMPVGRAQSLLLGMFGPSGVGLAKLAFPAAFSLALLGCLLILKKSQWSKP
jgi:hypothetical protein